MGCDSPWLPHRAPAPRLPPKPWHQAQAFLIPTASQTHRKFHYCGETEEQQQKNKYTQTQPNKQTHTQTKTTNQAKTTAKQNKQTPQPTKQPTTEQPTESEFTRSSSPRYHDVLNSKLREVQHRATEHSHGTGKSSP